MSFFLTHCFVLLGLPCYPWAFSVFGEQGLFSSCSAQASYCGGFSCCRAQAVGFMGFKSLAALQHVQSSWIRDRNCVPCIGRQTRESPEWDILVKALPL